jgi:septum formation topological specificity factor MinE
MSSDRFAVVSSDSLHAIRERLQLILALSYSGMDPEVYEKLSSEVHNINSLLPPVARGASFCSAHPA